MLTFFLVVLVGVLYLIVNRIGEATEYSLFQLPAIGKCFFLVNKEIRFK